MVITLISAAPGDIVPGHELADPHCPCVPGLALRDDVIEWMSNMGYGPDDPNELVYLVIDPKEPIATRNPTLTIKV